MFSSFTLFIRNGLGESNENFSFRFEPVSGVCTGSEDESQHKNFREKLRKTNLVLMMLGAVSAQGT